MKLKRAYNPVRFLCVLLFASLVMACEQDVVTVETENHQQAIQAWRAARHERLNKPDGWLTLVGLEWLEPGETRVGRSADNDVQLGGGPDYWGTVVLKDGQLSFQSLDSERVEINGHALSQSRLVPDTEGEPTVISSGTLSFNIIFRESYALRIKDSQAGALKNFRGVDNYPIDQSWRIESSLIPATEGAMLEITNVLGQVYELAVFGTFEFKKDDKTHQLLGLGTRDSENLWFIFADRTNGHGTYGAGRYLYSDGMPVNGQLTVDFNKSYNPPCAFNPYSTCPIPPQGNRLDLFVLAGEKDFHPDSY